MHDYLHDHYKTFEGKVDLAVLFIERTMGFLNATGRLGMIIQRRWFKTNYGRSARTFIMDGNHLHKLLEEQDISLEITDDAKEFLAERGYNPIYGARPLKRTIRQLIENPLSKKILKQEILPHSKVTIDVDNDELTFKSESI